MHKLTSTTAILALAILAAACGAESETPAADPLAAPDLRSEAAPAVTLGWEYFNRGDLDAALRRFEIAIRQDSSYAPAYYGVAYIHSVRGELDDAIKYYHLTLERDQSNPYTFANLGYALLQKERFDEALPMLDKALEIKPDCGEAHLSYANYYAFKRNWKAAEASANKAVQFGQSLAPEFRALLVRNGASLGESKTQRSEIRP